MKGKGKQSEYGNKKWGKMVKNFFSRFGFLVNIGFAILLLLVYISAIISPDKFWPAAFLSLTYPYLLLINLLFAGFYALRRSKKTFLSLLVIMAGYYHLSRFVQPFPKFGETTKGLMIASFNVHHFKNDLKNKHLTSPSIVSYLQTLDADIICLQETRLFKSGKLSPAAIKEALPGIKNYQLAHSNSYAGPMTFSKYPIITLGEIRFAKSSNMVLFSDILLSKMDTVRVYNCHLQSYSIAPDEYSITDPAQTGTNEKQLMEAKIIVKKMKIAFVFRASQARQVAEHIRKCRYPVIVCGDFNDTPHSYTYRVLSNGLNDAFVGAGFGVSNTYNGNLPSLRIDYILYSDYFSGTKYTIDNVKLSDHFPIHTILRKN